MSSKDDPIAAKSVFLASYMSQHADTLVAYIVFYLQSPIWSGEKFKTSKERDSKTSLRAVDIKQPRMLKITSKEMTIQYRDARVGRGETKKVDIPFDPPMLGYEEVRPRLLQMKIEAEEGIGMPKRPTVSVYRFPTARNTLIVVAMVSFWVAAATTTDPDGFFGRIRRLTGGEWTIRASGMLMVRSMQLRVSSPLLMLTDLAHHRLHHTLQLELSSTVPVFGSAGLLEFRKVVREARIAGISKTN
ncbi:MAG: hypothetical protein ASARMPRED_007848 [Alectoria sarmentosa]|nr:MAG: hypothetical protein ASARMPRED_007848 [Alectoria sarmentosa]